MKLCNAFPSHIIYLHVDEKFAKNKGGKKGTVLLILVLTCQVLRWVWYKY